MEITTFLAGQAVTIFASVAVLKANNRSLRLRVRNLEDKFEALPEKYVPRSEVEHRLLAIESNTRDTSSMVQGLILGGSPRFRIQAAAGQDFLQITIAGCDGHGGLNRWETPVDHLYLDNRRIRGAPAPLVTVGLGCALGLDEALTLPFEIEGRAATLPEIAADYSAVRSGAFGMKASWYAHLTRCRLPANAIDALVQKRFAVFVAALRRMYSGFDGFPETVKAGCLDLIYGLGVDGFSPPHYPSFHAAVHARDWAAAAMECGSDTRIGAYDERNEARKQLFLQAAHT